MGFMDKAKGMMGKHDEKVDQGVEQAGDFADDKTGGEHSDQIDTGQEHLNDAADSFAGTEGDEGNESEQEKPQE